MPATAFFMSSFISGLGSISIETPEAPLNLFMMREKSPSRFAAGSLTRSTE